MSSSLNADGSPGKCDEFPTGRLGSANRKSTVSKIFRMKTRRWKSINTAAMVMAMATLTGCAAQKSFVKAYQVPDEPLDRVALVKPQRGIIVESIDGDRSNRLVTRPAFGAYVDAELALKPGSREIAVNFDGQLGGGREVKSTQELTFRFPFEAGRRYLLCEKVTGPFSWEPAIRDVTGWPSEWTTTARCP